MIERLGLTFASPTWTGYPVDVRERLDQAITGGRGAHRELAPHRPEL